MPSSSLYVGDTDQCGRAIAVDQEKLIGAAARFLGPRQLPIRVKAALATVMLIIECKQLDRSNCQPIDIIVKE